MMVRYHNARISVAVQSVTKRKDGVKVKAYDFDNPIFSGLADIQPNTLTTAQIELFGISAKNALTKKCFVNKPFPPFPIDARCKVEDSEGVKVYSIAPVNIWRDHAEFLLIPIENEGAYGRA